MSSKRRRHSASPSHDNLTEHQSSTEDDESTSINESKLPRASQSTTSESLVCSLPPFCAPPRRPTRLGSLRELEAHYTKYHTHICKEGNCRNELGGAKTFPDARLLELHQTEYHDELAAIRNERGESIFACFLESCPRKFHTPKGRRLHLIDAHGYPKLYFFAVTKHGIGGLLARYGEGATLIRKPWKPRTENTGSTKKGSDSGESDAEPIPDIEPTPNQAVLTVCDEVSGPQEDEAIASKASSSTTPQVPQVTEDLDDLASSMKSLSLVPTSIRFGRGARRAGFVRRGASRGGVSHVTPKTTSLRKRQE